MFRRYLDINVFKFGYIMFGTTPLFAVSGIQTKPPLETSYCLFPVLTTVTPPPQIRRAPTPFPRVRHRFSFVQTYYIYNLSCYYCAYSAVCYYNNIIIMYIVLLCVCDYKFFRACQNFACVFDGAPVRARSSTTHPMG